MPIDRIIGVKKARPLIPLQPRVLEYSAPMKKMLGEQTLTLKIHVPMKRTINI